MNLDEIIELVRKEAKKISTDSSKEGSHVSESPNINILIDYNTKTYHVNEFISYDDEDFILNIYRKILKREPDPTGYDNYVKKLKSKTRSKADIILSICRSEEAKKTGVTVKGIYAYFVYSKFKKIPIIGRILDISLAIFQLPEFKLNLSNINRSFRVLEQNVANLNNAYLKQEEFANQIKNQFQDFQKETNKLENSMSSLQNNVEKSISFLNDNLNEKLKEISQKFNSLEIIIKEKSDKSELKAYQESLKYIDKYFHLVSNEIQKMLTDLENSMGEKNKELVVKELETINKHYYDKLYLDFESIFRGSSDSIKNNLLCYKNLISEVINNTKNKKAVDIGCGRGEFLEILKDTGFSETGVDINELAVMECLDRGLNAIKADINDYLDTLTNEEISVFSMIHVAEHFESYTLIEILKKIYEKLEKNGCLILETPNPRNILVGASDFYRDFTHNNPLFPDTLKFLLEFLGYKDVSIYLFDENDNRKLFNYEPMSFNSIDKYISISRDYSIVGYKR